MRKAKKMFAVLVALVMLVSAFTATASASEFDNLDFDLVLAVFNYQRDVELSTRFDGIKIEESDNAGNMKTIEFETQAEATAYFDFIKVENPEDLINLENIQDYALNYDDAGNTYYSFTITDSTEQTLTYEITSNVDGFVMSYDCYIGTAEDYTSYTHSRIIYPQGAMCFAYNYLFLGYHTEDFTAVISPEADLPDYSVETASGTGKVKVTDDGDGWVTAKGLKNGEVVLNLIDANGNVADTCTVCVEFTVWDIIIYYLFFGFIWM